MEALTEYVSRSADLPLPERVRDKAVDHLLDTVCSIVSGSRLVAGTAASHYVEAQAQPGPATVIATGARTTLPLAALANGMAAHADETDDSHQPSRTHPGCAVVPAALAVAEARDATGAELLRAVAVGYDVCARVVRALWPDLRVLRQSQVSSHAIGGVFGAAASAAALQRYDPRGVGHLLSYVAQQASGVSTGKRDSRHVQKAYVFGGMPAHNALLAASFVDAGWPGIEDAFTGWPNFLDVVGTDADATVLTRGLGEQFEITRADIKRYPVGSPAQAPLEGLLGLLRDHDLRRSDIDRVTVRLPEVFARTVSVDREMPEINLAYLLEVALEDREVTFESAHDRERFGAWRDAGPDGAVEVIADGSLDPLRQAYVDVVPREGGPLTRHVTAVPGSARNPMSREDLRAKSLDVVGPVLGVGRGRELIERVIGIEGLEHCSELASLFAATARLDGDQGA